ncbi:MAG TPA: hypothetical protein VEH00_15340 [Steroidobacteraceae bacterium]|nr:hypothetical protein [Steroidobacteraceae bacterium]
MIRLPGTLVLAGLLALPGLPAAAAGENAPVTTTVLLSPAMQAAFESIYGTPEEAVLERTIRERVGDALHGAGCDDLAQVEITLLDARPTHPTDKQIGDNPALDRLRTHFVGGAAFSVRLLDPAGRELKSVRYDWYAPDDRHGSRAAEPWGDVRLASEGLGSQLAHECRALVRSHPTTS